MSARIFEATGFPAIATTSGGLAWALGFPDGEQAPWSEVVAATERIVRAIGVPLSVDIETGYAATPDAVASHAREIIRAGAVGINLEDGTRDADLPIRGITDLLIVPEAFSRTVVSRCGHLIIFSQSFWCRRHRWSVPNRPSLHPRSP